jgi:sialate O-acetylesterase
VKLPLLISDGMVMQRDKQLKLWGWASAGEEVNLSFGNNIYKTKADASGKWLILLPPQKAGGPQEMIFRASNEIRVRNILFGDVWICSGQSNLELTMDRVRFKYAAEIVSGNYPMIRQFTVPDKYNFKFPEQDLSSGKWIEAGGKSLLEFSAVAYFFAKELYERYKVPIGLINAALGGSPAESWISEEAIKNFPEQYKELQAFKTIAVSSNKCITGIKPGMV